MFGSCSQPIKANKISSCGTRDSQHPIRTAATDKEMTTNTISTRVRRCSSWRTELEILDIQSEQRQQKDDKL